MNKYIENYLKAYVLISGGFTWYTCYMIFPHNTITYFETNTPWLAMELIMTFVGFGLILYDTTKWFTSRLEGKVEDDG